MFKVSELIQSTKGRLLCGSPDSLIESISIDSRTISPKEAFIAIKGDNFDGHDFIKEVLDKGARCVILGQRSKVKGQRSNKKVSVIEVKDTTRALADIAEYNRAKYDVPVVAVTGSNGKTTTKEMIAWVLGKKFNVLKNEGTKNNHIGLPLTLTRLNNKHDMTVVEMGTNHPREISYLAGIARPNIGVITNIGPSHLEFLKSLEGVMKEKYSLAKYLRNPSIIILNSDDIFLRNKISAGGKKVKVFTIGIKEKSDIFASDIKTNNARIEFKVGKKYRFTLNTLGYYNIYNALVAIMIARFFGLRYKDIAARLSGFSFPEGRLNLITINKVRFINDTYNSNPLSAQAALQALSTFDSDGRKIFVMGDMLELGDRSEDLHKDIGSSAAGICDVLISVGTLSRNAVREAINKGFKKDNIFICKNSQEARDVLFKEVSPSKRDIVLVKGSRSMHMEEVIK